MVEICNWYVNEFTFTPRVCTVYWCLYKHLLWIPPQAVIASRASEGGQCLLITCHWLREGGGKARARGSRALTVRQGCCRLTTARAVRVCNADRGTVFSLLQNQWPRLLYYLMIGYTCVCVLCVCAFGDEFGFLYYRNDCLYVCVCVFVCVCVWRWWLVVKRLCFFLLFFYLMFLILL